MNIKLLDGHRGETKALLRLWSSIILFIIILVTVLTYEIVQFKHDGWEYFKVGWNINDCLFLTTFMLATLSDWWTFYLNDDALNEHGETTERVRIFYSCLVIFSFIKLLDNLRIFNNISFIVKMLGRVISELVPFLGLFVSFILLFSLVVNALEARLEDIDDTPYDGLTREASMAIFIFRTSLGDFDVDPFTNMPYASRVFMWCFWLVIVFANTIIFLNFLIAVISDVYE